MSHRVAIYARVSTNDQHAENQLLELRRYAESRQWTITAEYSDTISGSTTSRPELDRMLQDARRRRFDGLLVWKRDRLGRSLGHLVIMLDELNGLGITFVSLGEGIDLSTPAGRLMANLLGSMAQFERERLKERVQLGLARARRDEKRIGRPANGPVTVRQADTAWGISKSAAAERMRKGQIPPDASAA